ncbi:MAG: N-acetylmuramoyl-L-alanine amidase, partial [Pseudomonadota bacterium]
TSHLHADDHASIVYDARVSGDGIETRLELDMTAEADVRAFVLTAPNRMVIDMARVGFALDPTAHGDGSGLVDAYRYGLLGEGRSRIVADLASPVEIVSKDVTRTEEGHRLSFVLRKADLDSVLNMVATVPTPPVQRAAVAVIPAATKTDRAEGAIAVPGAGVASGPITVVIDPGHGGIDSGATSRSGDLEKNVVLEFSRTLRDKLAENPRFRPVLTRDDDRFIPLAERVAFARDNGARLFISVHADAVKESYVRGATVYTLSERASDARAAALASKENRVDMLAGLTMQDDDTEVADILIDLARRETKNFSILAARTLIDNLRGATRLNKNPIRSAGFKVLRAPDVPSVLLELGYLSNEDDAERFGDDAWRLKTAARIAAAVEGYFSTRGVAAAASPPVQR